MRRAAAGAAVGLTVVVLLTSGAALATPEPPAQAPVLAVTAPVLDLVLTTGPADGSVTDSVGEHVQEYVLSADVFFATGSAQLTPRAASELRRIVGQLREGGLTHVAVTGHTDSVGSDAANLLLSRQRAESVVAVLRPALPGVALTAAGRGETEPVAEEQPGGTVDPAARQRNRRVEVAGA